MSREDLLKEISEKTESNWYENFDAIYDDLSARIGSDHYVKVGIFYGIKIGASAVLDVLLEHGLLQLPD